MWGYSSAEIFGKKKSVSAFTAGAGLDRLSLALFSVRSDYAPASRSVAVNCARTCLWTSESEQSGGRPRSGVQLSVLRFVGLVEWSAVGLAERSMRSEDGRTADTAGTGGREFLQSQQSMN